MGEPQKLEPKSVWCRFSLRTMFLWVTLIAIMLAIYQPLTLHLKAVHYFNIENPIRATRAHPEELLYSIEGRDNAVVCNVGKVRIILLGRTHYGGTSGFLKVAGHQPKQWRELSVNGEQYFSYSYATGKAKCDVLGFPFLCTAKVIEIGDQVFDIDSRTVVLVDLSNRVLTTYSERT